MNNSSSDIKKTVREHYALAKQNRKLADHYVRLLDRATRQ